MKKRILCLLVAVIMATALAACGNNAAESEPATVERDLPEGDYAETGEGTMYISTAGGTSEDGNVPVIYEDGSTTMMSIGLNAFDFNGGALSYIYGDGMLRQKEQLAASQISLTLEKEQLTFGVHKVEVVQYEGDDPASSMITYRTASYEVKEK